MMVVSLNIETYSCGEGTLAGTTTTNAEGYYGFGGLKNGKYGILPQHANYVFSPKVVVVQIPQTNLRSYDFTATSLDHDGDGKENYLFGCSNLDGNCDYDDSQYDGNIITVVQDNGTIEDLRTYAVIDFNTVTPVFHSTRDQTFDYCSNLTWAGNSDWETLDEHDIWKLASANYTFDTNCSSYFSGCSIFSNSWDPISTWEAPPEPWLSKLVLNLYNGNWYRKWELTCEERKEISEDCTDWFYIREADLYKRTKYETNPSYPDSRPMVICKGTL